MMCAGLYSTHAALSPFLPGDFELRKGSYYVQNANSVLGLSANQKYQLHSLSRNISEKSIPRQMHPQVEIIIIIYYVTTKQLFSFEIFSWLFFKKEYLI